VRAVVCVGVSVGVVVGDGGTAVCVAVAEGVDVAVGGTGLDVAVSVGNGVNVCVGVVGTEVGVTVGTLVGVDVNVGVGGAGVGSGSINTLTGISASPPLLVIAMVPLASPGGVDSSRRTISLPAPTRLLPFSTSSQSGVDETDHRSSPTPAVLETSSSCASPSP
jgi:hypothetical protein